MGDISPIREGIRLSIFQKIMGFISYKPNQNQEPFVLKEHSAEDNQSLMGISPADQVNPPPVESKSNPPAANSKEHQAPAQSPDQPPGNKTKFKSIRKNAVTPKRPVKFKTKKQPGTQPPEDKSDQSDSEKPAGSEENKPDNSEQWGYVSYDLDYNKAVINDIYDLPKNKDFIIREFYLGLTPPVRAMALFMEGMSDKNLVNLAILQPLMVLTHLDGNPVKDNLAEFVKEQALPGHEVQLFSDFKDIIANVNYGCTAVFMDGCGQALVVETKGWEHRQVSKPLVEGVIRGPQEGFSETLRANTGLIRKQIRSNYLTTEMCKLGKINQLDAAIMYLRNKANPTLVKEVIKRIESIKSDFINDSGVLEQFIEDHPYSLAPQIIATERPDRVCAMLAQGRVAIIMDGSPFALVVPGTLFEQLHTSEDKYLRPAYGTAVRLIRTFSFYTAFLLPGIYVSVVLFHQEMIPTDLLLAISGAREKVPFPSIVEVLLMESSFELIREAGVRIPGALGNTIGIVGALILGQAAVQANIVSPILIIVVAVTGLASFAVPNYSLQFALRIARFAYIALGAMLGFFGIAFGLFYHIIMMASQKSFGVPYLTPAAPQSKGGRGALLRAFVWNHEFRPDYLQPLDPRAQPRISRGWVKMRRKKDDSQG